jgi:ADP-ribosylglycohydrolase
LKKEFIDYFENLDFANTGNTYDWFSLKIDLRSPITDETISKLLLIDSIFTSEELNSLHYFVHEYIHFLQNTVTHWGQPVLTDYAISLMKIGASSAEHETIFKLPINFEKMSKEIGGLFESGYDLFKMVKKEQL